MRNHTIRAVLMAMIAAIALFGSDNSIGTWKMNFDKSRFPAAVATRPKGVWIEYEAIEGGVKATTRAELPDGRKVTGGYTAKYDGKDYPVTGATTDSISIRQIDANTFFVEEKKTGGKRHTQGQKVISPDGKTMTFTLEGTDDEGKPIKAMYVYEREQR